MPPKRSNNSIASIHLVNGGLSWNAITDCKTTVFLQITAKKVFKKLISSNRFPQILNTFANDAFDMFPEVTLLFKKLWILSRDPVDDMEIGYSTHFRCQSQY